MQNETGVYDVDGWRRVVGLVALAAMLAGIVALVLGEIVLTNHGGSCSNGAVAVPTHPCTATTYRAGGLIAGGIVAMVFAGIAIAFTLGSWVMFLAMGVAFLAGALTVLLGGTTVITLVIGWGLVGIIFIPLGAFGLRSEIRASRGSRGPDDGFGVRQLP